MFNRRIAVPFVALALIAVACSDDDPSGTPTSAPAASSSTPATSASSTTTTAVEPSDPGPLPERLARVTEPWPTDWSRSTIDLEELKIGIGATDPRDRIPPLDDPTFETIDGASEWLTPHDPGLLVDTATTARFYPLAILTLHEIINDEIDGVPVAVTYCPLCNTGVVFDRRLDGATLRFGVSGLLRNSDLVMWDQMTTSLWQQITGEALVGEFAGRQLEFIPSGIVSFGEFSDAHPDGDVLERPLDQFSYPYGLNPYELYSTRQRPFGFFDGELDERFPALERVVSLEIDGIAVAYPFSVLTDVLVINHEIAGVPVVVFWGGDTADALDTGSISSGRPIGTGLIFSSTLDDLTLTFVPTTEGTFTDEQTGTQWTRLGAAIDGPLAGRSLALLPHRNDFWFAWSAFYPDAVVFSG